MLPEGLQHLAFGSNFTNGGKPITMEQLPKGLTHLTIFSSSTVIDVLRPGLTVIER